MSLVGVSEDMESGPREEVDVTCSRMLHTCVNKCKNIKQEITIKTVNKQTDNSKTNNNTSSTVRGGIEYEGF